MRLSITLPSLFPDLLSGTLDAINANTTGIDYEVVVVSPFPVDRPNVVWVPESEPRGNCAAHDSAFRCASGDLIIAMTDDVFPEPGWADRLLAFFLDRERSFAPYAVGLNVNSWPIGTVFGIYYPYFPVLRRQSVEIIGGYYSSDYRAHFGDCDLGLRVWEAGGRCEFCIDSRLSMIRRAGDGLPQAPHRSTSRQTDLTSFVTRWQPVYGAGWETQEIRDFNLNVPGRFFKDYIVDHTIFRNTPLFGKELRTRYKEISEVDFLAWD